MALLEEPPRRAVSFGADEAIDWRTVATFSLPYQAEAARLRLDAEGIPALLDGLRMGDTYGGHAGLGGIRLQVPRSCSQDARILLSQSWSVPADEDDDEDDVAWPDEDDAAPPVDEPDWRRTAALWGAVLGLLVIAACIALAAGP